MGQGPSFSRSSDEHAFFGAIQAGDADAVRSALRADPELLRRTTIYDRLSALHIAAANGRVEVLSLILDGSLHPDVVNRHKQTPLMLAAMHGEIDCLRKLLESGANILMFDSLHGRTCLHHAAHYGQSDCLQAILSAARSSPVAGSWGFARFVNVRDDSGATPLHLAARQGRHDCVHILLENGAIVSAPTGTYGFPGSTPLHLAARGGSLDCVRQLLSWGADRLQRDSAGRIPYEVALKRCHGACAALLNPSSAEPLVWPSPLKFISELDPDAKALLEAALMEANREREKKILKGTRYSLPSPSRSDDGADDSISEASDAELCSICFDQICTISILECGHQMCAPCTLALCCHTKPNATTTTASCPPSPACPFCRRAISRLAVVVTVAATNNDEEKLSSPKPRSSSRVRSFGCEGSSSSSFKSLSLGKLSRGAGWRGADDELVMDKP
ncbi:E3 ubiquitin-protein ligase XB3-like [Ananas comosus]|uniref:RING-type E3 ubiquitin transferase n=1 Tax=Ananas comosus TaxID=4615 RepID=A0A199VCC8_ANACO|nr:E3 ubiquitin-protein ligase XB3-like [Ananas comosus]OAY74526.1 E3 ubiquitin-protein ligase XB3 [Ananas comosus]